MKSGNILLQKPRKDWRGNTIPVGSSCDLRKWVNSIETCDIKKCVFEL